MRWTVRQQCTWVAGKEAAPSGVAGRLRMTRGAISKLAERLLAKGLVRRRGDSNDARRQNPCLTARGRKLMPALAALADTNDEEFFASLRFGSRPWEVELLALYARPVNA